MTSFRRKVLDALGGHGVINEMAMSSSEEKNLDAALKAIEEICREENLSSDPGPRLAKARRVDAERDYLDIYLQYHGRDALPAPPEDETEEEFLASIYKSGSPCGGSFERLDGKWWWDGGSPCVDLDIQRAERGEAGGVIAIIDGNCYFEDARAWIGEDGRGEYACVEEDVFR
jgi:hypothetical protein